MSKTVRRIIVIAIIAVIILGVIATVMFFCGREERVFKKCFGFSLPETAEFVEVKVPLFVDEIDDTYISAKIKFDEKDLDYIKHNIENNGIRTFWVPDLEIIKVAVVGTWTIDLDNVVALYASYRASGYRGHITRPIRAYIAQEDNQYYLYVDC